MRYSVSEMAKLSGVSIRTLHYYDEIGLLRPSEIGRENSYRFYDEQALERLQQILFYRELDFQLKEIADLMIVTPAGRNDVLAKQKELLLLKRKRLDGIIRLLDANLKGEKNMSFTEFESKEYEQARDVYANEVKKKWGHTEAYKQNQKKTAGYTREDMADREKGMDELIGKFAEHLGEAPESEEVQKLVGVWKQFITDNYYDCTDAILAGLGQMYIADERFMANMDKHGAGTAKLISDAIEAYCLK